MLAALASAQISVVAYGDGTTRIEQQMAAIRKGRTAFLRLAEQRANLVGAHEEGFLNAANRTHIIPTLFFIGGQKCGSSAVYRSLIDHPLLVTAVLGPSGRAWQQKEPNFFSNDQLYSSLPEGMFRKMPMRRGPGDPRLAIESSPTLSVGKYVAHRIRHAYGMRADRLRFLVILRNPTLRAFSYFKFAKRADRARMWFHQKFANLSFLQMVRQQILILRDHRGDCKWMNCAGDFELKGSSLAKLQTTMQDYHMVGMLTWGNYYPHLKNYMDGLDSTQFYIIDSRKFESDWYNEMVKIFKHYGLDPALANMSSTNHRGYIANAAPDLLKYPNHAPTISEEKQHARGSAEWLAENRIDADLATAFDLLDEYYRPFNEKLYELFEQNNIPFRRWGTWQDDYKVHLATKIAETFIVDPAVAAEMTNRA